MTGNGIIQTFMQKGKTMTDYIKRDDAMKIICSNCTDPCALVEKANNPCAAIKELVYLPSADVAPVRHGHWIKISPAGIYECSECQKNVMTSDIKAYEYCHGCGSRMDGESDE